MKDFNEIRAYVGVSRKEDSPEDVVKTELSELPNYIIELLGELPVMDLSKLDDGEYDEDEFSLFDDIFENEQFWLLIWKGRTFFVDTQGFTYARYCGEIV
jgi:hypothetical protein